MATEPDAPLRAELQREEEQAGRNLWRGLVSLGVLIALVVGLLLAVPGLHGVADQVAEMNVSWLIVAVVLEILSCLGYVLAFLQVFDRAPIRFGARVALSELAFGAAVSLGGAGSAAIGALLLVERGGPPGRVAQLSAVLFLLTSAVNVITLVLGGLGLWTGLLAGPHNVLLSLVPAAVGTVTLLFFLALPWISERYVDLSAPGRLRTALRETVITIQWTKRLMFSRDWRLLGAFGFLWFDIAALAACFAAAGHVPPLATLVLAYQIGYLSNILPIPGSVGILDGSIIGMFVLYGVGATLATAATVVYHAIALWIPAMWGTIAFLVLRRSRGEPLTLRPPREERRLLREERRRIRAERRAET
jgi:uncharacterized membrane protein YbhN (UPF0104 family)